MKRETGRALIPLQRSGKGALYGSDLEVVASVMKVGCVQSGARAQGRLARPAARAGASVDSRKTAPHHNQIGDFSFPQFSRLDIIVPKPSWVSEDPEALARASCGALGVSKA